MLQKEKINGTQVFAILVSINIVPMLTALSIVTLSDVPRGAWLAAILVLVPGLAMVLIVSALAGRYPGESLFAYTSRITGRPIGWVLGLLYILFFLDITARATRELSEFFTIMVMPETPLAAFIIMFIILGVAGSLSGIEAFARVSTIFLLPILGTVLFGVLANLNHVEAANILPVAPEGFRPLARGVVDWIPFIGVFLFPWLFLAPNLDRPKNLPKVLVAGVIAAVALLFAITFIVVGVFRPEQAFTLTYPFFQSLTIIELGGIIQRVEFIFLFAWVALGFTIVCLFFHLLLLALGNLFGLRNRRPLALPTALVVAPWTMAIADDYIQFIDFQRPEVFAPFGLLVTAGLPLVLLLVDIIRRGLRPQ